MLCNKRFIVCRDRFTRLACFALAAIILGSGVYSQPTGIATASHTGTAGPFFEAASHTKGSASALAGTDSLLSEPITTTMTAARTIYLPAITNPVKGFFVAPNGSPRGDGSANHPWDLETAFAQPRAVTPGSTIWLHGGTYRGVSSKLKGTSQHPIIVRQYPGERAIIDGVIMAYGEYTWFWGFEITNSEPRKLTASDHYRRGPGLGMYGTGQKAINLIIYNAGHPAISFGEEAQDGEIYGCVIWGTGLYQDDLIRGSGIYGQNLSGDRLISDVISFRNFTTGMKTWSQSGGHGNGFLFEGVISFDNGDRNIFAGSSTYPLQNLTLIGNATYRRPGDLRIGVQLGYENNLNNQGLQVSGNYFVNGDRESDLGALGISYWASGEISNNTVVSRQTVAAFAEPGPGLGLPSWKDNHFFGPFDKFWYGYQNGSYNFLSFGIWRNKLGFDGSNVYTPELPSGTQIFVRPNKYEFGRGNLAIYNWDKQERIAVDLSSILREGSEFWIYDAQNLLGLGASAGKPAVHGVYDGGLVYVPMNLTEVSPITGEAMPIQNVHTPIEFGAYVVISK